MEKRYILVKKDLDLWKKDLDLDLDLDLWKKDLDLWKKEIQRVVDNKISRGKTLFKRTWSKRLDGSLATELARLKQDFIITVADKAQNNILFTCKYFYIK